MYQIRMTRLHTTVPYTSNYATDIKDISGTVQSNFSDTKIPLLHGPRRNIDSFPKIPILGTV